MKLITKKKMAFLGTFSMGIIIAIFIWSAWKKLNELVGDTNIVLAVTGGAIIFFIIMGWLSLDKVVKRIM